MRCGTRFGVTIRLSFASTEILKSVHSEDFEYVSDGSASRAIWLIDEYERGKSFSTDNGFLWSQWLWKVNVRQIPARTDVWISETDLHSESGQLR